MKFAIVFYANTLKVAVHSPSCTVPTRLASSKFITVTQVEAASPEAAAITFAEKEDLVARDIPVRICKCCSAGS